MAYIKNLGFLSQLRSESSNPIIRFRNGHVVQSGRGITFWFWPEKASISEVPMDDREMTVFVKGRSKDFQDVGVQGSITWHVTDPQLLAQRVDFSIGLSNGIHRSEPLQRIETRLTGLASQATLQYMAEKPVRELLDSGLEPLRARLETTLASAASLAEVGVGAEQRHVLLLVRRRLAKVRGREQRLRQEGRHVIGEVRIDRAAVQVLV